MADVTDATFTTDVVERSRTVPVVVDLWAEWCGPCRTLGPILEKVVADTGGQVELAKVDIDANPSVASMFQVQSIPAVYAMKDGKVVDGFLGAQPEWQVAEFVQRLYPSAEDREVDRLVAAGDEASLRAALELEPSEETVIVALAELLVSDGRAEEGLALLERIPESPATRRVAALAHRRAGRRRRPRRPTRLAPLAGQGRRRRPPAVRRPARADRGSRRRRRLAPQARRTALLNRRCPAPPVGPMTRGPSGSPETGHRYP